MICSFDQLRACFSSLLFLSLCLPWPFNSVSEFQTTKRKWALSPSRLEPWVWSWGLWLLSIYYLSPFPVSRSPFRLGLLSFSFPLSHPGWVKPYTFGHCFWTSHIGGGRGSMSELLTHACWFLYTTSISCRFSFQSLAS